MMLLPSSRLAVAALACSLAFVAGSATAVTRAECERDYKPQVGQTGKDVVWVPTPNEVVQGMLGMAKVTPTDLVYDLGAGDGKIAIAAGKLGATAIGIEYNPDMAKLASCLVQAEGVPEKTRIIQGDIFKEDFSKATVVTMYLLPELNLCVRHRLLAMAPGTRITTHEFRMGDWDPDESFEREFRNAHLWIVPARVEGTWVLKDGNGASTTIRLKQSFQKVGGEVVAGAQKQTLVGVTLRGNELKFAFNDDKGSTQSFTGTVKGGTLDGRFRSGYMNTNVTGTAQGPIKADGWADMAAGCQRFYGG